MTTDQELIATIRTLCENEDAFVGPRANLSILILGLIDAKFNTPTQYVSGRPCSEFRPIPPDLKDRANVYTSTALQGLSTAQIEAIVTEFREYLGIPLEWGYVAGHPIIRWMPPSPH